MRRDEGISLKVMLDLIRNTKEKISDWFKFAGKVQLRRGLARRRHTANGEIERVSDELGVNAPKLESRDTHRRSPAR